MKTNLTKQNHNTKNVFLNLLYIIPLQVSMGLFIIRAFINMKYRNFEWKGRKIG